MNIAKNISNLLTCIAILLLISTPTDIDADPTADAQALIDAKTPEDREKVYLDIFPKRTFAECDQINKEFTRISGKPLVGNVDQHFAREARETIINDLLFCKIYGPDLMKVSFLKTLLNPDVPAYGGILLMEMLIMEDDKRDEMIGNYNHHNEHPFDKGIEKISKHDYRNFLNELIKRQRQPLLLNDPVPNDVEEDVKKLHDERKKRSHKGWNDKRKQLDYVLMETPINYAIAVIARYLEREGNELRHDVEVKLKKDDHLVVGYPFLVDFILDKYLFMATRLNQTLNADGKNVNWNKKSTAINLIIGNSENGELEKINDAFTTLFNKSIKDFILEVDGNEIVRKILAATVENSIGAGNGPAPAPGAPPAPGGPPVPQPPPP